MDKTNKSKGVAMLKQIALIIMLVSAIALKSEEPVVEVTPLPPEDKLEMFEATDELFVSKVLEYYDLALMLRTQLEIMGEDPDPLYAPSFDELLDLDVEVIQKYHGYAKIYENQIRELPSNMPAFKVSELKRQIRDTVEYYTILISQIKDWHHIDKVKIMNKKDSASNAMLRIMEEEYYENCKDFRAIFSASGFVSQFISNGDGRVGVKPSPGARLNLNLYKILGFGRSIDLWYEYQAPVMRTERLLFDDADFTLNEDWNSNLFAVGLSFNTTTFNNSQEYKDGLKLGVGYFWTKGNIYNKPAGSYDWEGTKLDVEYYGGIPNCGYPFELYARLSIYHSFSDDLELFTGSSVDPQFDLGRTHIGLSLGLRYNFWRSPF
ncbi:MAG: hypothetical protein ACLFQU_10940 [Candidatus Kapaibacterium sp.]